MMGEEYVTGKRRAIPADADEEEIDKLDAAVEIVAELQLTAEQLKVSSCFRYRTKHMAVKEPSCITCGIMIVTSAG